MWGSLKYGLKLLSSAMDYFRNQELMDAGEAKANAKNSGKVLENVDKANKAADGLASDDERKRVRDKFSRSK